MSRIDPYEKQRDENLRLECLKLAQGIEWSSPQEALAAAIQYYAFVKSGQHDD